jgi:diguanylate cyclase (GGDEF)-like protein
MPAASVPDNEQSRLRYLQSVEILNTPPEQEFDDLALLASQICQTPVALVTTMDSDMQWFKAHVGTDMDRNQRQYSLCAHTILQNDLLVVPDLRQDRRFEDNPLVVHPPNARFYAGMPLVTAEGFALGTLCVVDLVPRTLSTEQSNALRLLGRQVVNLLRLRHKSRHDSLTGLPNRSYFLEQVDRRIDRLQRDPNWLFAAMFIDLDRFKIINDSLGHAAGDAVLSTIAGRFRKCLRGSDTIARYPAVGGNEQTVARLGGDEFTVLLDGIRRSDDAARVAGRLLKAAREPVIFEGQELRCSASIGVVVAGKSQRYEKTADLVRDADTAMYRAKMDGKNCYALFDREMHDAAMVRLKLESDLQSALHSGEFELLYQPIVSLRTGQMTGLESLIRWRHGGRVFNPSEFIPVAEDTGAINPIGRWVIQQAVRQLATWRSANPQWSRFSISVNLSRKQLVDAELIRCVQSALSENAIAPSDLELEITETAAMQDPQTTARTLDQLHAMGVGVAIDDFGAGYSSLSCLHQFPVNVLKIDRAFLQGASRKLDKIAVIKAVVNLAQGLGLKVVAEGLETAEQAQYLRSLHCDMGQGYFFSRPLTAEQLSEFLSNAGTGFKAA